MHKQPLPKVKCLYTSFIKLSLIIVISAFLLNGCGIVNKVRLMHANNDVYANWQTEHHNTKPKSEFIYAKPYIYVSLNGVDKFKMLIDSGSSISMLFDTSLVKQLQLTQGYELKIGGYGGHDHSRAYQTEVTSLTIGELSFNNVSFGFIPV